MALCRAHASISSPTLYARARTHAARAHNTRVYARTHARTHARTRAHARANTYAHTTHTPTTHTHKHAPTRARACTHIHTGARCDGKRRATNRPQGTRQHTTRHFSHNVRRARGKTTQRTPGMQRTAYTRHAACSAPGVQPLALAASSDSCALPPVGRSGGIAISSIAQVPIRCRYYYYRPVSR
jgi:hypothetical protein